MTAENETRGPMGWTNAQTAKRIEEMHSPRGDRAPDTPTPAPVDLTPEVLARWEELAAKATAGPWQWAGNTDTGEPYLATWLPGAGRCTVLDIGYEDRTLTGREADHVRSVAEEYDLGDPDLHVECWATDRFGEPVRDPRLRFGEDLMMVRARDRVIYEVAPQAESREDPNVYRADISGIRHPDAEFIAAARDAVPALLSGVRSRDARIAEQDEEIATLRQQRHDAIEAVAARDAVIEEALIGLHLSKESDWPGWNVLDGTERILSATPSSVLAARDAEKWDEGHAQALANIAWPKERKTNPYRAGADHE